MPLKDLLRKKDRSRTEEIDSMPEKAEEAPSPQFTIMRSDTTTQEIIQPPHFPEDEPTPGTNTSPQSKKRLSRLRRFSNASTASTISEDKVEKGAKGERRLSQRLGIRSRNSSASSANLPADLPDIDDVGDEEDAEKEAKWEKRATLLAMGNLSSGTISSQPTTVPTAETIALGAGSPPVKRNRSPSVSAPEGDVSHIALGVGSEALSTGRLISLSRSRRPSRRRSGFTRREVRKTEALRLPHAREKGFLLRGSVTDLPQSTKMFGRLADPDGPNNALSQVLYGLALRSVSPITRTSIVGHERIVQYRTRSIVLNHRCV